MNNVISSVDPFPTRMLSGEASQYPAMTFLRSVYSLSGYVDMTSSFDARSLFKRGYTPSGLTFAEKLTISSFLIPYIFSIFSRSLP